MKTNIENTTKILEVKKMNKTEFDFKSRTIREVFSDTRKICIAPKHEIMLDEGVHPGGDIFTTEDGEYIDFETQLKDFDAEELAKYVELAEDLYEKHGQKVSIYIICANEINVYVNEFEIPSDADFTIRLARVLQDICKTILDGIKEKMKKEKITEEDLYVLSRLHKICKKEEKHYYMLEYLKIANRTRL